MDEPLLLAIAAGLLVVLLALRWMSRGVGERRAQVIVLTASHRLHVVELEGRRLVVGTGPGGAPQLLTELAERPPWAHLDEAPMRAARGPRSAEEWGDGH